MYLSIEIKSKNKIYSALIGNSDSTDCPRQFFLIPQIWWPLLYITYKIVIPIRFATLLNIYLTHIEQLMLNTQINNNKSGCKMRRGKRNRHIKIYLRYNKKGTKRLYSSIEFNDNEFDCNIKWGHTECVISMEL